MNPNLSKIFNSLIGTWKYSRTINKYATVSGIASFVKTSESSLLYLEEGTLQIPETNYISKATREFLYCLEENNIVVYNASNTIKSNLIFKLEFNVSQNHTAQAIHYCGEDTYNATFVFNEGNIYITYDIHGPKKDMQISTLYKRQIA